MKYVLTVLAFIVFTAGSTNAQTAQRTAPTIQDQATQKQGLLVNKLGLNQTQATKIYHLYVQALTDKKTALDKYKVDHDETAKKNSISSIKSDIDARMKLILTADQYVNFKKMQASEK